jgi:hypothetical protein
VLLENPQLRGRRQANFGEHRRLFLDESLSYIHGSAHHVSRHEAVMREENHGGGEHHVHERPSVQRRYHTPVS